MLELTKQGRTIKVDMKAKDFPGSTQAKQGWIINPYAGITVDVAYVTKAIRTKGELKLNKVQHPYADNEAKTWDAQLTEARAFLADVTSITPLITQLAEARGITKADLVSKIVANADLFKAASGAILGQQQRLLDRLATEEPKAVHADVLTW
jgi:hypothetical protein